MTVESGPQIPLPVGERLGAASAELVGILSVHKESGWTSHDVVARVRRLARQRRVGHAGTLDPLAEGVLPVLLGRATRLADLVGEGRKEYRAEVRLGAATTTDDAEGEVVERRPVPTFSDEALEAVLARFRGPIEQVPPAYSAVKVAGQRAYAVARRGGEVALAPRRVVVYRLDVLRHEDDLLELLVECSRGTYVRSLARDVARALGTAGHLTHLVRTRVGPFALAEAHTLGEIAERGVEACLLPPEVALLDAPRVDASQEVIASLRHGRTVPAGGLHAETVRIYDPSGTMQFIGSADGQALKARITLYPIAASSTRENRP